MNRPEPMVFIVDDDEAVLKALSRLFRSAGMNVSGFSSPQAFLDQGINARTHGCAVLDVEMPGLNGLELQQAMATNGLTLPILFLTGRGDIPLTVKAMKQGAIDFLTKPVDEEAILNAVRTAIAKDAATWHDRMETADTRERIATLTPREREVLDQVVRGEQNKHIATELGAAERTIKIHRARVMEKMNVDSVAELVRRIERADVLPASGTR